MGTEENGQIQGTSQSRTETTWSEGETGKQRVAPMLALEQPDGQWCWSPIRRVVGGVESGAIEGSVWGMLGTGYLRMSAISWAVNRI